MTDNLTAPEWCLGCPYPIYDDRKGEWIRDRLEILSDPARHIRPGSHR